MINIIKKLKFKSGISVDQARKDAKKLSKSSDIKLGDALNQMAQAHHGVTRWDEALVSILGNAILLGEKSGVVISGVSGCGKTPLAIKIANKAFQDGACLNTFYITTPGGVSLTEFSPPSDGIGVHVVEADLDFNLPDLLGDKARCALVIIDEAWAFSRPKALLLEWLEFMRRQGGALVLISHSLEDVLPSWHGGHADEQSLIGYIVLGKSHPLSSATAPSPEWSFLNAALESSKSLLCDEFIAVKVATKG